MQEINKPEFRTFWEAKNNEQTIVHRGVTETNQVTTTDLPILNHSTNAGEVFPPLPSEIGVTLIAGEIYSYSKGMVTVISTHERTADSPEELACKFIFDAADI